MRTKTALVELLKDSRHHRIFFKGCCKKSAFRLRAQAYQFREELARRGYVALPDEVEDALLELARNVFPESAAARWDAEWASELCRGALKRLAGRYSGLTGAERDRLDLSAQDPHEEAMLAAGEENDPAAFRAALKEWERAGLEGLEDARKKRAAS